MTHAHLIGALMAIDPAGLGGVWIRSRHGPEQQTLLDQVTHGLPSPTRISPDVSDEALFGGVDLTTSLAHGRIVKSSGVCMGGVPLLLVGAERMTTGLAARLSRPLDDGTHGGLFVLDEGTDDDPLPPSALLDRLAFFLTDGMTDGAPVGDISVARKRIATVETPANLVTDLTKMAVQCGIASLRAPVFAVRATRALAALEGASKVTAAHAEMAVKLVYAHRMQPQAEQDDTGPPPDQTPDQTEGLEQALDGDTMPSEVMLDAVKTTLPDGALTAIAARAAQARGSGKGRANASKQRGRPLPSRSGRPDGRSRIDLLGTLSAAVPWQKLRGAEPGKPSFRSDDIRLKRYEDRSERLLIFVVDASGSAAMARLAEAKGAAEHLLAEAYRSRDNVALIAFRGETADLLLPPTRSLVRTKRALATLPGGGGTPLAAGLKAAYELADQTEKRGLSPQLIVMTDARGNRTLSGETDRKAAQHDQTQMARLIASKRIPTLLVDCGRRIGREVADLGKALDARTIRLPASGDTRAIQDAL